MSALTVVPVPKPVVDTDVPVPRPHPTRMQGSAGVSPSAPAEGFGFADLVDTINPLQQLPLVGSLYRAITGDEISQQARYAGSALYGMALGGPIGMGAMMGMAMVDDVVMHPSGPATAIATSDIEDPAAPREVISVAEAVADEPTAGAPVDLFQWLRPEAARADFPATADRDTSELPVIPASVDAIAAHPANRLPPNVLEILRERHMGLLADEQA